MFAVNQPQIGDVHEGFCESCGESTDFVFIGEQEYPTKVAEKLKIAPIVQQWRCLQCETTVTVTEAEAVA